MRHSSALEGMGVYVSARVRQNNFALSIARIRCWFHGRASRLNSHTYITVRLFTDVCVHYSCRAVHSNSLHRAAVHPENDDRRRHVP